MKRNYWMMMLALLAGGVAGCSDDGDSYDWKKEFEKEQANIATFVKSKDSDAKVFTYYYTYLKENITDYTYLFNYTREGKTAASGDFVWINYTQLSMNGGVLDATNLSLAVGSGITPYYTFGGPLLVQMNTDTEKYEDPLSDFLMCIPEGTKGSTIMSSVMSMSNSYVYREYTVEKIVKEQNLLTYEKGLINNYLDTVSGLDQGNISEFPSNEVTVNNDTIGKIARFVVGQGDEISLTDSVTVWMEGNILDAFGTSRKFLKMKKESVVESVSALKPSGLRTAMLKLKVGDEVQVLLPSGMGYGYEGGFDPWTRNCLIPGHSTLLYTIKVIDTKENPKK